MTGDGWDRDLSAGDGPETWVDELRESSRTSPLAEASRLGDLADRRTSARNPDPDPTVSSPEVPVAPDDGADSASPLVAAIRRAASVDDLRLDGAPTDHRYGRVVDATARVDGRVCDLQLRLFRRPDGDGDFADALSDQLDRWTDVSDLDGVVPVLDGAGQPRPWTCTAPVGPTLTASAPDSLAGVLRVARSLSGTLAAIHDRGVCHTGLDPTHVVAAPGGDRPLLDSVGLFDVYRRYSDPSSALDLRYAPPEYFDDRYGVADRTTDVYGLGAVLYYLFTGRPPHDGDPAAVREAVLTEPFPRPSDAADFVPEAIDDIVARATATDKFDRYRSATALYEDVRELCLWMLDE